MSAESIIRGNFTKFDSFYLFLIFVMGGLLLWYNTNSPSSYTAAYVPFLFFNLLLVLFALAAQKIPDLKSLPFAFLGFGELDQPVFGKFKRSDVALAAGTLFGLFLAFQNILGLNLFQLAAPTLAITDPTANLFMSSIGVAILEESATVATVMPSLANFIAQAGLAGALATTSILTYFFFAGFATIASVGLLLLAFYLRAAKIKNAAIILGIAIFLDGCWFALLHLNAYSSYGAGSPDYIRTLLFAFVFRVIADIMNVSLMSVVPSITAHIINNAVAVGSRLDMGWLTFAPYVFWVIFIYIISRKGWSRTDAV